MTATHGLKGKVKEIITQMDVIRKDSTRARDIGLREFMAENYEDASGNPLEPEHLYSELGIDPQRTTVKEVMSNDDTAYLMAEVVRDGVRLGLGAAQRAEMAAAQQRWASQSPVTADFGTQRFMSPEVFLDPVRRGAVQAIFFPDLVIREEPVAQPNVTVPKIELSDAALKDAGEAVTIEEGSVSYGSKDVKLKKKGRALKVSYEAVEYNSLSLAQIYFEDAGAILGNSLNNMAVKTIIDGDQADGSEAAAVIGVKDTAVGVQWYDLARVAIQFALLGRTGLQALGNALSVLNYVNLPEMKNKQFSGLALLHTMLKAPLQFPEELYPSMKVPTDQLAIQDPSKSLVQLTAKPLMIETEKIISKQLFNNVATITTGFAKIQRNASIILDGSKAFSTYGFPAWMYPYDDE